MLRGIKCMKQNKLMVKELELDSGKTGLNFWAPPETSTVYLGKSHDLSRHLFTIFYFDVSVSQSCLFCLSKDVSSPLYFCTASGRLGL